MIMAVTILLWNEADPLPICVEMIMGVTIDGREPPGARGVICPYME